MNFQKFTSERNSSTTQNIYEGRSGGSLRRLKKSKNLFASKSDFDLKKKNWKPFSLESKIKILKFPLKSEKNGTGNGNDKNDNTMLFLNKLKKSNKNDQSK